MANENRKSLIHIHSKKYENNGPKAPTTAELKYGEIAINFNETEPAIFIKAESGTTGSTIVKFNPITKQDMAGKSNTGHTHAQYILSSTKGQTNGVASLDNTGKVPATQLPSYVDDVIEGYYYNGNFYSDSAHTKIITGESGKIYVDLHTNKTYRWSGSTYVEISQSLTLGTGSTNAYYGNLGQVAYNHSQLEHQANWNETDSTKITYIQNKPTIGNGEFKVYGNTTEIAKTSANTTSNTSLTISAGTNVSLTTSTGKIVINATDTNTHYTNYLKVTDGTNEAVSYTQNSDKTLKIVGGGATTVSATNGQITVSSTDTDTHYTNTFKISGNGTEAVSFAQNVNKTLNIVGGGATTVSASEGKITVSSTDTNTHYTNTLTLKGSGITVTTFNQSSDTSFNVVGSSHITVTPDATNKKITISTDAEPNVQSDWNQTNTNADDYIKNKPTIPSVGNGTLTIQRNGTQVGTFTANQTGNATINITVPTQTSDITNNSNFEVTTNKVTAWTTTTAHTHYPSEKLVKDSLDGKANTNHGTHVNTGTCVTSIGNKTGAITLGSNLSISSTGQITAANVSTNGAGLCPILPSESTTTKFLRQDGTWANVAYSGINGTPTIGNGALKIKKNGTATAIYTANQTGDTTLNVVSTEQSQGLTDNEKSYARANIGAAPNGHTHPQYQDKLPQITNNCILHTNASTGTLEWANMELFWCTYGTTTFTQINNARNAGQLPIFVYSNNIFIWLSFSDNKHWFSSYYSHDVYNISVDSNSVYTIQTVHNEGTENKVTAWTTTTAHTHYPSEKLVKDSLDGKANTDHTHLYAASSSAGGDATNADKVDGYHISVVTSIPASPDANTIYILK